MQRFRNRRRNQLGRSDGDQRQKKDPIGPVLEIQVQALYAIYQIPGHAKAEPYWPEGEYGLIFKREENGYSMPVLVRVSGGKIVRIDHAMGHEPSRLLEGISAENIVLRPEQAAEWVKKTPTPSVPPFDESSAQ